ncbi:twin-arginine translocation pathway signal [Mycobacterium helveticum]|uniref:twin-arginine translocation pathway signal n=1 Tax=Mycobacterium helveticum TaxID=2592811 RepID=UPI001FE7CC91|nr:twin-arginine translocation pathway signal [Mycobacterium helveticum]
MTVDDEVAQDLAPRPSSRVKRVGRLLRRGLARWRPIVLTIVLVASTGFAAGYFYVAYRPDLQTDAAARHQAVKAASDGAVALLSYSPDTLTRDFDDAKSRVTDSYLNYYQQFAEKVVGPAAMRGQVTTTATVVKAAVSEMHPNSAVVLAFVTLKTTSKDKPDPVLTSSSLKVVLTRVKDSWLIENFEAVSPAKS